MSSETPSVSVLPSNISSRVMAIHINASNMNMLSRQNIFVLTATDCGVGLSCADGPLGPLCPSETATAGPWIRVRALDAYFQHR